MEQENKRIFLWAVPRSISTAFLRAMENRSETKVILEPYSQAFYFGEERTSKRYIDTPVQSNCTFKNIQQSLEDANSENQTIFVKDMANYIFTNDNPLSILPSGYQHTFLIRDPYKAIKSLYKMSINSSLTGWTYFDPTEAGYEELWKLYTLIRDETDRPPVVIDAEDLINNPEGYFAEYCKLVGIEFEESMLSWDNSKDSVANVSGWLPWFQGVLGTDTIMKPHVRNRSTSSDLPEEVAKCIEDNLVYYRRLCEVKVMV